MSRPGRKWLGALAVAAALAATGLTSCVTGGACCEPPLGQEVDTVVAFTWTIDGAPASTACARAGIATVFIAVGPPDDEHRTTATVPCADGAALVPGRVFAAYPGLNTAGGAELRARDADGVEVTARSVNLLWVGDQVQGAAELFTPVAGTAIRYRWCRSLGVDQGVRVTANGPMYFQLEALAPSSEIVIGPLAPGRYTLLGVQFLGGPRFFGPSAHTVDVAAGQESLVTVDPCPPAP